MLTKTVWSRLGGEHHTARGNRDLRATVLKDGFALTCIGDAGRRVVELDPQGAAPAPPAGSGDSTALPDCGWISSRRQAPPALSPDAGVGVRRRADRCMAWRRMRGARPASMAA
jgi:hypothetical protein